MSPATPALIHTSTLCLLSGILFSPFNSQRADASIKKRLCPVGYYITISTDKRGGGAAQGRGSNLSHRGLELYKGQFQCEPVRERSGVDEEWGLGFGARLLDGYLYTLSFNPSGARFSHLKAG